MNLYEINEQLESAIEKCVNPETGEILDAESLINLQIEESEKIENIALYIKNLSASANEIRVEESALAERRRVKQKKAEWLENYLSNYLLSVGKTRYETPKCALSFRKSESVEIDAGANIPERFMRIKDPEINKADIKAALKLGEKISGARLVTRQNLQIK